MKKEEVVEKPQAVTTVELSDGNPCADGVDADQAEPEKFTRELLMGKTSPEIQQLLDENVALHKSMVSKIDSEEALVQMEADLIEVINAYDKELGEKEYDLAEKSEFDGKSYSAREVANRIVYFLNKNSVEWATTLALYQLTKFWKDPNVKKIPYKVYDTTLRMLNNVKFQGMQEWTDILTINEYLSGNHHAYTVDTSWYLYLSECHSQIMSRISELRGEPGPGAIV